MGRLPKMVSSALPWALATGLLGMHPPSGAAQTLRGSVLEMGTARPVQRARMLLLSTRGDTLAFSSTDGLGRFSVSFPEPGDFLLQTTALGYRTSRGGVFELGPGGELVLEIRLHPEPVSIEGLIVERPWVVREPAIVRSGFLDRMALGRGHFFTPLDLARSTSLTLTGILADVPRLAVVRDRVLVLDQGRYCIPSLILDGMVASVARGRMGSPNEISGSEGNVEALVPLLTDLEAVEVYRGGAEMPDEFAGMSRAECGAIVMWTRRR